MACSLISSSTSSVLAPRHIFVVRERLQLLPVPSQHRWAQLSNKPFLRGSLCVARFGFKPGLLAGPDMPDKLIDFRHLLEQAEGIMYTLADGISTSDVVTNAAATATDQKSDWLSGITNTLESVLKVLKDSLSALHIPYSYGFAIILLTILVKAATFPLTKKQVESTMAVRAFQPQIKAIQLRYAGDQEKIQLETARLYKLAGVNPFAGCLPTLATIPVWIGLYRALSNVANKGLLTEGFFWIPSLAGPTSIGDRQNGTGVSWLFPFVDGHPPLGWSNTLAYLVLPLLLVISQYVSVQVMQSAQNNDPSAKNAQAITRFLPLMIGYFALSVPSGLSLYWFTNNILSTAQQYWLQKSNVSNAPSKQIDTDFLNDAIFQQPNSIDSVPKSVSPEIDGSSLPGERFKQIKEKEARKIEESLSSTKPLPGERFRQIKEEEARRRKQTEDDKTGSSVNGHNQITMPESSERKDEILAQNGHLNEKNVLLESEQESVGVEKQAKKMKS